MAHEVKRTSHGIEVPLEAFSPRVQAMHDKAAKLAVGTNIKIIPEYYRMLGSGFGTQFDNASDVLVIVGGTPTAILHRPINSSATLVDRTNLVLNGDIKANAAVLRAFGFSQKALYSPKNVKVDGVVSYVMI